MEPEDEMMEPEEEKFEYRCIIKIKRLIRAQNGVAEYYKITQGTLILTEDEREDFFIGESRGSHSQDIFAGDITITLL